MELKLLAFYIARAQQSFERGDFSSAEEQLAEAASHLPSQAYEQARGYSSNHLRYDIALRGTPNARLRSAPAGLGI